MPNTTGSEKVMNKINTADNLTNLSGVSHTTWLRAQVLVSTASLATRNAKERVKRMMPFADLATVVCKENSYPKNVVSNLTPIVGNARLVH